LYDALARLGDAFALAHEDRQMDGRAATLRKKIEPLARHPFVLHNLASYAGRWLTNEKRGHQGVVVCGTVLGHRRVGQFSETQMALNSRSLKEVTVVSRLNHEQLLPIGGQMLVLGTIVDDPQADLIGYAGSSAPVIVPGFFADLPTD
jgi:hypothetical protein